MSVDTLNGLELPRSLGVERQRPTGTRFDPGFDSQTLFYDAFFVPRRRSICLICPQLRELRPTAEGAQFSVDGRTLRSRISRRRGLYEEIWVRCSEPPDRLTLRFGDIECQVPVAVQDLETFAGMRCAVLKSKDNELGWIRDWAEYHVAVHGLQAVLVFDNASETYSAEDVDETLRKVEGLERVRVVKTPFRYGPRDPKQKNFKFLTSGILNIAKLRYFQRAKAVLNVDVDELVRPVDGGSIFTAVERALLGYVAFEGRWRYPDPADPHPARHEAHFFHDAADDASLPPKYCIRPRGLLGALQWSTHGVRMVRFAKTLLKSASTTDQLGYWHCRRITTDWKYTRDVPPRDRLERDTATADALARVFEGASKGMNP